MSAESSGAHGGVDTPLAVDAARSRRTWRIGGWSAIVGVALALVTGLLGGDGRTGMAVLLLVSALGCGVGALYGIATLLVDDLRDRPVTGRRAIAAVVLFLLAAILMAMVAAVGG